MSTICCPKGYTYVYSDGTFLANDGITYTIGNPDKTPFIGHCVRIANKVWAIAPTPVVEPIDCPCCPSNFIYSSIDAVCINVKTKQATQPVPCITCVCPPEPTNTCANCGTEAQAISFTFDFTTKYCTSCTPQDGNGPSCMVPFLPAQFVDPILNFKLRNKNFI